MDLSQIIKILLYLSVLHGNHGAENSTKDQIKNYSSLDTPFRSQKVNLLWTKARTKLSERKLKQLHTELKVHDKEQMALKKLKTEGSDKEGIREAEIRKQFNGIMYSYGLVQASQIKEEHAKLPTNTIFKDKKLERLWQKAHKAGLEEEELHLLKKEFQHHQDKLDQFHRLKELAVKTEDGNLLSNDIHLLMDEEQYDMNTLDGKAKALKDDYARLHRLSTNTQPTEFVEPKVKGLWKLAQEADFTTEELESLKAELHHYEKRLEKLHHLKAGVNLIDAHLEGKMDRKLAKHSDSVERLHMELASKIAARHSEL